MCALAHRANAILDVPIGYAALRLDWIVGLVAELIGIERVRLILASTSLAVLVHRTDACGRSAADELFDLGGEVTHRAEAATTDGLALFPVPGQRLSGDDRL